MAKLTLINAAGTTTIYETSKIEEKDDMLCITGKRIPLKDAVHLSIEGDLDMLSLINANIEVQGCVKSVHSTNGNIMTAEIKNIESRNGDIQTDCMQGTFHSFHGEEKHTKKALSYEQSLKLFLQEESCKLTQPANDNVEQTTTWFRTLTNMFSAQTTIKYDKQEGILFARVKGNIKDLSSENGNIAVADHIESVCTINGEVQATKSITGTVKTISADLYANTTMNNGDPSLSL